MTNLMRGITVRTSLLAVLLVFAAMIVLGGIVGVLAVSSGTQANSQLAEMARQVILANDGYKDTTRTRSALTRAYSALKERGDKETRDSALISAESTIRKAASETKALSDMQAAEGIDATSMRATVQTSTALGDLLVQARDALRAGDTERYVELNDQQITVAGQHYSTNLEAFQREASAAMSAANQAGHTQYRQIVTLVAVGVALALGLLFLAHTALRRVVIHPLHRATILLDQIASNDLSGRIDYHSRNEIGHLFDAMRRMQDGLSQTVSLVRSRCEAIGMGTHEIAAGNLDLSARTEEQSASLGETSASMKELASTVKRNADNAKEANHLASTASEVAQSGGAAISDVIRTMEDISTSSRKIADITGLIDGIAFQTNILALNAAVEAARAGEQGRGFAVVAGEVRNLAQRSANAAKEIKQLIEVSATNITHGNRQVTQAGQTMNDVVSKVSSLASLIAEISAATLEQSDGIGQVEIAVSQMDQVTQQNAALVEQASAATSSLESQVDDMVGAMAAFRL